MAQNDIGIDLGTTTIIIAQEGQGVVLNQPSVVAVDTRKNCVLEAGDKALAMVGRTPNYISAIFPLKDGVISDHTMPRELICRFVKQVDSSHMVKPRVAVCVPAAITGIESDAVVEAVVAAGARQVYLIDEPIAAALGSGIDITLPDGRMIIDIGGGTTGIAILADGTVIATDDEPTGGKHLTLVLAGALGLLLRKLFWPRLFAACGRGVVFGASVVLRQPGRIRLGERVVVSDGCILDGRSDERAESIVVGDDAMLSNDVMLSCKNGSIRLGEHVGVNARTIIQSTSGCPVDIGRDCIIGQSCLIIGGGSYDLDDPDAFV